MEKYRNAPFITQAIRHINFTLLILSPIIAVPILLLVMYFSFGGDYSINLPNGYEIVRTNANEIVIASSKPGEGIVVSSYIDSYAVFENIATGHVTRKGYSLEHREYSVPGYFILDMKSGGAQQGLSEEEWISSLLKHEITKRPNLRKPSRLDSFRIRITLLITSIVLIGASLVVWRFRKQLKEFGRLYFGLKA